MPSDGRLLLDPPLTSIDQYMATGGGNGGADAILFASICYVCACALLVHFPYFPSFFY